MENIIHFLSEHGYAITIALISIISSIANIVTMFVDETKVNKWIKPIIKILNFLALNIFKNKNKTDK